jgi:hypothetical protein
MKISLSLLSNIILLYRDGFVPVVVRHGVHLRLLVTAHKNNNTYNKGK